MIKSKQNAAHYFWGNNCEAWVLKTTDQLSVKQEKMPPNTKEEAHYHKKAEQIFYILSGIAVFYIEEQKITIREGETLTILPEQRHYIANESDTSIEFLVISQPDTQGDRYLAPTYII